MRNAVTAVMLGIPALLAATAPSAARRLPRAIGGTVLSARSISSTGPIAFYSEFFNVSYLSSGLPPSANDPGQVQFGLGGKLVISFPNPSEPLRLSCYLSGGRTLRVRETFSPDRYNPPVETTATAGDALHPAVIDMPAFAAPQVLVQVTLIDGELLPSTPWTLNYCSITPRP